MSYEKAKAMELFDQKYNCAQSIFLAYCEKFDINRDSAFKLTTGFGGGIAGLGEICGAINAAVMLLGLKYGTANISDMEGKKIAREKVREFIGRIKEKHTSIYCRDLLTEDKPIIHKIHSEKCSSIVGEVCDLLDEYLK